MVDSKINLNNYKTFKNPEIQRFVSDHLKTEKDM